MKTNPAFLILSCLAGLAALVGCSKPGPTAAAAADVAYYTCTMHPSVRSQDPNGKCPICGMDLVPVKGAPAQAATTAVGAVAAADQPREFAIPLDRQQMIGVTYATVERKLLRRTIRAVGLVAATTANHWDYVARVDGYVRNLRVSAPGDRVEKGQVLMDLYSPDVVATESEYIDLIRMRDIGRRDRNDAVRREFRAAARRGQGAPPAVGHPGRSDRRPGECRRRRPVPSAQRAGRRPCRAGLRQPGPACRGGRPPCRDRRPLERLGLGRVL